MVLVLKKEVSKTESVSEHEDTGKYRQVRKIMKMNKI